MLLFIKKYMALVVIMLVLHQFVTVLTAPFSMRDALAWNLTFTTPAWASEPFKQISQSVGLNLSTESTVTTQEISHSTPTLQEGPSSPANTQTPKGQQQPAEEQKPSASETPLATKKENQAIPSFVDVLHSQLSQQITDAAIWMDSFFADENYVKEENHSYLRFRYDVFEEERSKPTFNPAFDLRLGLPQLERKTHLVFSSEPAQPVNTLNAPVQTPSERFGTTEQRNLTAAVHYLFRSTAQENFITRVGIQFSRLSPVVLFEPRYRVLFPFTIWNIRFTQDILWRSDTSWQSDTRFDFERLLPYALFFRTSIDGVWVAHTHGYVSSLSFALRQPLAPTHALNYEWINTYQTRPVGELVEVAFRIRYRHSFWREWLFFELSPQLRFPRALNFDSLPGILFRLEMFFGGY